MNNLGFFFCFCCDRDQDLLWRVYKFGQERMNREFNLIKLIRTVRNMKIFIKKELMSDKQKIMIQNSEYNLIDIDDENDNIYQVQIQIIRKKRKKKGSKIHNQFNWIFLRKQEFKFSKIRVRIQEKILKIKAMLQHRPCLINQSIF